MITHWPLSLLLNLIILRVELTWLFLYEYYIIWVDVTRLCVIVILLYIFVIYNFVIWMSISVYIFVMLISVQMNFNIIKKIGHAHLCMNDYPYSFGFSAFTFIYAWISSSIFFWIFVMHIYVLMTILIIFRLSWCTSLYEWLSILLWVFVMYIFVQRTIHNLLYFRHAHLCTNKYSYFFSFLSCTSLYEQISILFLYGFSSYTSLYKWLYIFLWVFVIHIFVRMNIHIFLVSVFIMHIFVRMTIHIITVLDFVMHIFVRMTINIILV